MVLKGKKFGKSISVLLVVMLLVQVMSGFGALVFAEGTGIEGQTGTSGAIYYDFSDAAQFTAGGGASGAGDAGAAIASTDGVTFSGKAFREAGGWGTASLTSTINVAEAGDYYVAFGVATSQNMNGNLTYDVNGTAAKIATITATEDADAKWYDCGIISLAEGDNTVKLTRSDYGQVVGPFDVLRIIKFVPAEYTITTGTDGTAGASVTGAGTYLEGEDVTLTATVPAGYLFAGWGNDAGEIVSGANPYTFTAAEDVALTAIFETIQTVIPGKTGTSGAIYYDVADASQITGGGGFTTAVSTGEVGVASDDGLFFSGNAFREAGSAWGSASMTIKFNVATAGYYYVAFGMTTTMDSRQKYSINNSTAIAVPGLTETTAGANWYEFGPVQLTQGENTLKVTRDGYNIVTGPFDVIRIAEAVVPKYNVTVDTDGTEGATVDGAGSYPEGSSVTLTATAPAGYGFAAWKNAEGEIVSTANPYTFEIAEDTALTATFKEILPVIPGKTGTSGAIYYDVEDASQITLGGGVSGTTSAGAAITSTDGVNFSGKAFREVGGWGTASLSVKINVPEGGYYNVAFGVAASQTMSASQTYSINGSAATALPAVSTASDANWYEFGPVTLNPGANTITIARTGYGIVVGPVDVIKIAEIETAKYTVTANTDGTEGASVSGAGRYAEGMNATLTAAVADTDNYTFDGWYTAEGALVSSANPYSFTVNADTALVAKFAEKSEWTFNHRSDNFVLIDADYDKLSHISAAGCDHVWVNGTVTKGQYTLNGIRSGMYELYFKVPFVNDGNTPSMTLTVVESDGNATSQTFDIQEATGLTGESATGIKSGDWIKLDGTFGCDGETAITLTGSNTTENPDLADSNIRYAEVKVVRVSDYVDPDQPTIEPSPAPVLYTVAIDNAVGTVTGAGSYEYGESVTVTATADEGYAFDYWQAEDGKILSKNASYTFTVTGNVSLIAQFKDTQAETYNVVFKNINGVVLGTMEVEIDPETGYGMVENADEIPVPTQYGKDFIGWSKSFPLKVESDLVILPRFEASEGAATYTVTANGEVVAENLPFDSYVKVEAPATNDADETFSYWENANGKIVSYSNVYSFYVSGDVELTAVYNAATPVEPIIKSDNVIIDAANSKMSFVSQVILPEGYTLVECGTLIFNQENFDMNTEGVVKVKARTQTDAGQFMASLKNVGSGKTRYARGYLVYKDAEGNLTTVYGDVLTGIMD